MEIHGAQADPEPILSREHVDERAWRVSLNGSNNLWLDTKGKEMEPDGARAARLGAGEQVDADHCVSRLNAQGLRALQRAAGEAAEFLEGPRPREKN